MNTFYKKVNNENLYIAYMRALRGIYKLTDAEIRVFAAAMYCYNELKDNKLDISLSSSVVRQKMFTMSGVTKATLSVTLTKLVSRDLLIKEGKQLSVNEKYIPEIKDNKLTVSLIFDINE